MDKPTFTPDIVLDLRSLEEAIPNRTCGEAADEIMRLRERLEIGYAFNVAGERVACEDDHYDGIACRDETIKLLERALSEGVRVPEKPTTAMLRPFMGCPDDELEIAYAAMRQIVRAQAKFGEAPK